MVNEKIANTTWRSTIFGVIALVILLAGVWLSNDVLPPEQPTPNYKDLDAARFPQPHPLTLFNLIDFNNRTFGLHRLKGQWSFLFFGYTQHREVCPTMLQMMQEVRKNIAQPSKVQFVFISLDPKRDSPEKLKHYVGNFHSSFFGVTGTLPELDNLTKQVGIHYQYIIYPGGYVVSHSGQILLIDPQARLHAVFSTPHKANTIADNFLTIQKFYKG